MGTSGSIDLPDPDGAVRPGGDQSLPVRAEHRAPDLSLGAAGESQARPGDAVPGPGPHPHLAVGPGGRHRPPSGLNATPSAFLLLIGTIACSRSSTAAWRSTISAPTVGRVVRARWARRCACCGSICSWLLASTVSCRETARSRSAAALFACTSATAARTLTTTTVAASAVNATLVRRRRAARRRVSRARLVSRKSRSRSLRSITWCVPQSANWTPRYRNPSTRSCRSHSAAAPVSLRWERSSSRSSVSQRRSRGHSSIRASSGHHDALPHPP